MREKTDFESFMRYMHYTESNMWYNNSRLYPRVYYAIRGDKKNGNVDRRSTRRTEANTLRTLHIWITKYRGCFLSLSVGQNERFSWNTGIRPKYEIPWGRNDSPAYFCVGRFWPKHRVQRRDVYTDTCSAPHWNRIFYARYISIPQTTVVLSTDMTN